MSLVTIPKSLQDIVASFWNNDLNLYIKCIEKQYGKSCWRDRPKPTELPKLALNKAETKDTWYLSFWGNLIFQIKLLPYPKCCGIYMLYDFYYRNDLTKEQLHALMDGILACYTDELWFKNRRIVTVMVESRYEYVQKAKEANIDLNLISIPPVENPHILYSNLWDYWHKQAYVNDRLMFNQNSNCILHDMEVILK